MTTEKSIRITLKKYGSFYAYTYNMPRDEAESEVGFAIAKAIEAWEQVTDRTAQFKTFCDRVIKNHMTDYRRGQALYARKIVLTDNMEKLAGRSDAFVCFDVLSAFSGREYHIASEFISPSDKVIRLIRAIKVKFEDNADGGEAERRLLKAGVDCFAVSLVYDISIRQAEEIKGRIYGELKKNRQK